MAGWKQLHQKLKQVTWKLTWWTNKQNQNDSDIGLLFIAELPKPHFSKNVSARSFAFPYRPSFFIYAYTFSSYKASYGFPFSREFLNNSSNNLSFWWDHVLIGCSLNARKVGFTAITLCTNAVTWKLKHWPMQVRRFTCWNRSFSRSFKLLVKENYYRATFWMFRNFIYFFILRTECLIHFVSIFLFH